MDDGNGQYELVAVISHIGKNTDHGHYVCHVKKDNQWVLFNDDKVKCVFTLCAIALYAYCRQMPVDIFMCTSNIHTVHR